jgi:hypothetical protein
LIAQNIEEIGSETGRWGVCAFCAWNFLREGSVEEVERAFVTGVVHVVYIGFERPVHGFGTEEGVAVVLKQVREIPGLVGWPGLDGRGENEGAVCPGCGVLFEGEVWESVDEVLTWDVLGVFV